jgi:hypothetical protein
MEFRRLGLGHNTGETNLHFKTWTESKRDGCAVAMNNSNSDISRGSWPPRCLDVRHRRPTRPPADVLCSVINPVHQSSLETVQTGAILLTGRNGALNKQMSVHATSSDCDKAAAKAIVYSDLVVGQGRPTRGGLIVSDANPGRLCVVSCGHGRLLV